MNYIDTHCHLDLPEYHQDLESVINQAFAARVEQLINIGTDLLTSQASINLAHRYRNIFAAVGMHPHDARLFTDQTLNQLEILAKDPKVVAIGEIGLDYFRNLSARTVQKKIFALQLQLALKLNKPVIIHCRDAYSDLLEIIDQVYLAKAISYPIGVIHSFSGGVNYLQEFLKRGFYIGINGMITYPNSQHLIEAIKLCSDDKLLLETDAPFLAPQAYRGQRNEPAMVIEVAKLIAQIKQCPLNEVAHFTTLNAKQLFKLP